MDKQKTKVNRKQKSKTKTKTKKVIILRKKFKGGQAEAIPWDYGGTAIEDLPADIIGVIVHTINTIVNAVLVVDNLVGLPANMGTAFSSPNEPNPNDVDITGM
jgi:hypothetical protein